MSERRPTMSDMDKDTRLTFRMSRSTREALERAAEEERRSISDLAVIILEDWLAARPDSGTATRSKRRGKGRS